MKKLTYIACLFASASFGMNCSMNQNINSSFELFDSFEENVPFAESLGYSSALLTQLNMSEEYFADGESLANSVDMQELRGTTFLSEYIHMQPDGTFIDMNYIVANNSNSDVATMTLRQDPETNTQYEYVSYNKCMYQPNMQQSYSMSEDSETYTDDSFCDFVDESSSDSDDNVDFFNSSLYRRPFEFM